MVKPLSIRECQNKIKDLTSWGVELHEHFENSSTIYYIENINNGRGYVGSSWQCLKRIHEHFYTLRAGKHCNQFLQRAFPKGRWAVCILEVCSRENLIPREQFWIDELHCVLSGYNLAPIAGGSAMGNPEVAKKVSQSLKTYYANPEVLKHRSEVMKVYFKKPGNLEKHSASVKAGFTESRRLANKARIKAWWAANPEKRAGMQKRSREFWGDVEKKEKRVAEMRKVFADPEYRKRQSEIHTKRIRENPDAMRGLNATRGKFWKDPVKKAAALAKRKALRNVPGMKEKTRARILKRLEENPVPFKALQAGLAAWWANPENRAKAAERTRQQMLKRHANKSVL